MARTPLWLICDNLSANVLQMLIENCAFEFPEKASKEIYESSAKTLFTTKDTKES
jgi:hypothetical protein